MIAVDVPIVLLGVGVVVLCLTTTATVLGFTPTLRRGRLRPEVQLALPPAPPEPQRRVITGPPVDFPRRSLVDRDAALGPSRDGGMPALPGDPSGGALSPAEAAEAAIARMLDDHPEVVARVLAAWIANDVPRHGQRDRDGR